MQKITPNLWFDDRALEAAEFYVSVFKDSEVLEVTYYGQAGAKVSGRPVGSVLTVAFRLGRQRFLALNGGPAFRFSEAVSFVVNCKDQKEIDYYWKRLAEGGQEGVCGWLKDRFGLSWQVVPVDLEVMTREPKESDAVMAALLQMRKIDLGALERAYEEV